MNEPRRDLSLSRPIRKVDPKKFSNLEKAKKVLAEVPALHARLVALVGRMETCAAELDELTATARHIKKELEERDAGEGTARSDGD